MPADPRPEPLVAPTSLGHAPETDGPSRFACLVAEALGSLLIVLAGVGAALFASDLGVSVAGAPVGIGFVGVALAFGLALVAANYAFGPVSGGHFNPAVTVGLAAAGRFPWRGVLPYAAAQLAGALVATTLLVLIGLFAPPGWLGTAQDAGFASNGFGELSPGGFGVGAAIIVETLFAALFVVVVLGVTHRVRGTQVAGMVIGLALVVVYLVLMPIDLASINPARSIATAVYGGAPALGQAWVFLVFPLLGALCAGVAYRALLDGARRP